MTQEHTVDQLIVGSGGAGLTAALAAADAGSSVVVLEQLDKVGGSTGYSGGLAWMPNNPLMAREGVPDSPELAREYIDATVPYDGPGASPERREAFIAHAPAVVSFLEDKGMRWQRADGYSDYYDDRPGGSARGRSLTAALFDINRLGEWKERLSLYPGPAIRFSAGDLSHVLLAARTPAALRTTLRVARTAIGGLLRGRDLRGAGGTLMGRLLEIALREGIDIRTGAEVTRLLVEDGGVVGAEVDMGGRTVHIGARQAVVMASGGFAHNRRLRDALPRQPSSVRWSSSPPGDTGALLEQAMALGAATDCLDEAVWNFASLGPDETPPPGTTKRDGTVVPLPHHFDISLPHSMIVDQAGRRFVNEAGSYMEYAQRQYERNASTGGRAIPAWAILESRHRRRYFWGTQPPLVTPRSWLKSGYMIKANSIDELARRCGIDLPGLRATVERFNACCQTGVDEEYGRGGREFDRCHGDPNVRPNPNLGAIARPPFYAVRLYPGDVGTFGGLVTDAHARVLREDGSAIPGLYATGPGTAQVCGRSYIGAGASIGPAMTFGYVAARHAAHSTAPARDRVRL